MDGEAILVEVVTANVLESLQWPETLRLDGTLSVSVLNDAFDDQARMAEDRRTLLAEELRTDDGLRETRFIFEREEDESFRGAGALAHDDRARSCDAASCRHARKVRCRKNLLILQIGAEMLDEMRPGRELHRVVVGHGVLHV